MAQCEVDKFTLRFYCKQARTVFSNEYKVNLVQLWARGCDILSLLDMY